MTLAVSGAAATAVACPICGSPAARHAFALGDRGELPLFDCPSCKLVFAPVVEGDALRHDRSYHQAHETVEDPVTATMNAAGILDYWSQRLNWAPGTSILDLGCAEGRLMEAGRARGFRMQGIDVTDYYVDRWREAGLDAEVGTAEELLRHKPGLRFDAIITRQVIEHVRRPMEFMRSAHELLRAGGTLIVETGNPQSLQARLLGKRWSYWSPREGLGAHVTFVGSVAARELARRSQLTLDESIPQFRYRPFASYVREQRSSKWSPLTIAKYLFHRSRMAGGWCHRFTRTA